MNLLFDPWIPIRLQSGEYQKICFSHLSDGNISDFAFPRADFQGAAYQFAIGVLQTLFSPKSEEKWLELYQQAPNRLELLKALENGRHAFEMKPSTDNAVLFMQDYDSLEQSDVGPISGLLIEAPGGNALKLNTDHFIKRGLVNQVSLSMAAIALFTLQINAPAGGQGHRTGIRGGGPLTSLVLPHSATSSLWQKIWLNVLSREKFTYDDPDLHSPAVFPWLGPTKESKQLGTEIYEKDVHPLHMYWAMPRRIRLEVQQGNSICDLDGAKCEQFVSGYRTQNYGYNYSGSWWHPLTHYRSNPQKPEEDNLSTKGQPGGVSYKQWQALTMLDEVEGNIPAKVALVYSASRAEALGGRSGEYQRLWVFGYDMDNMKARGWYSTELPLFNLSARRRDNILKHIKALQLLASETLWQCRTQIKSAWFSKPGEVKGDTAFIDLQFWQRTERNFYLTVAGMLADENRSEPLTAEVALGWLLTLKRTAIDLFDELVLSDNNNHKHMARFIKSRRTLTGWLFKGKAVQSFMQAYQIQKLDENKQEAEV
jgi:CRISPR system Cascade subunit CasA